MAHTSVKLVRLLAEPRRRAVVAALVLADAAQDSAAISSATGLSGREVAEALERLVAGELVSADNDWYSLEQDAFIEAAKADADAPRTSEHGDQPDDVARVLDTVFRDGRLVQWPSKRSKRLIVLDHLSQQFEIGVHYTEDEVNERLAAFTEDVATPRRYLVDEWFLDRIGGEYWRCGGSIPRVGTSD